MTPRLRTVYKEKVVPDLMKKFSYKNVMQVPKIERIVLNMGLGKVTEAGRNNKIIEEAVEELATIVGQRPVITKAKKSIAGFKLREEMPIGCMVTLRGTIMYEFLDRLINLSLPRVRDFKGVSHKSFDGRGNYTLGIKEHIIFPEIDYSKTQLVKGMNITFVTTSNTDNESKEMLELFGLPFIKN
jgi:large subunit ribosomal protein L5